jgi:hypothetical protein
MQWASAVPGGLSRTGDATQLLAVDPIAVVP